MRHPRGLNVLVALVALSSIARADLQVSVISESGLPFNDSPSNFQNSPGNFQNSPRNFQNSSGNFQNSPGNFQNSPSNYDNGANGKRRIYNQKRELLGYYTLSSAGVMNFYSTSGARLFYHPASQTKGVFFTDQASWAGLFEQSGGHYSLGLTQSAYDALLSNQR